MLLLQQEQEEKEEDEEEEAMRSVGWGSWLEKKNLNQMTNVSTR